MVTCEFGGSVPCLGLSDVSGKVRTAARQTSGVGCVHIYDLIAGLSDTSHGYNRRQLTVAPGIIPLLLLSSLYRRLSSD